MQINNIETEKLGQTADLKEKAKISIEKAKEIITEHIPKEEISAIYVKGSYVQDELGPDSDVDVVVVLKSDEYLQDVYKLTEKFGDSTNPPFQAVAYTLEELGTGKKSDKRNTNRMLSMTPVSVFVKHLDDLPLIYGDRPEGKLFTRTDMKDLESLVKIFNERFLPDLEKGDFGFRSLLKQVLWLVEREQRVLGQKPDYSWQKLAKSIHDKDHIIHTTLKLRRQGNVSERERANFLNKLKDYLKRLEDKYSIK